MHGRSVLITGCSSGIGRDAALTLGARGWRVLAACRRAEDAAALEALEAQGVESLTLDYADAGSVAEGAAEALRRAGGRLDALVNNGAYALPAPLEDVTREAMRELFEANFLGWHDLTRRLLPGLRASGRGRIVNISSVLGLVSLRYRGPYNASKFAVEGLSDCLRRELAAPEAPRPRVSVHLVEPGPIRTAFRRNARARMEAMTDRRGSAWERAWREKILPRLEAPETEALERFEQPPAAVTRRIVHALEARRPRPRYYVTAPTWAAAFASRALNTSALDFVFRGDH